MIEKSIPATSQKSKYILSVKKNGKGMLIMFCAALITSLAQLIWKLSGSENIPLLILGIGLYGLSSVLMVVAFRFGSLSVLHPIMSLSYGFGLVLGSLFLHEIITPVHIIGVLFIMMGVIVIGSGDA